MKKKSWKRWKNLAWPHKLLQLNLNSEYFNINASNQLSPVFELKGITTGQGLSFNATTKSLSFSVNNNQFFLNPNLLIRLNGNGGIETLQSIGLSIKLSDNSLSCSSSGLQVNLGSGLMTSINGLAVKLSDTSLDVSNLGLQVSTTYKSELQQLKNDTETFKTQAQTAKTGAETAKTEAESAKTQAEAAKTTATQQATTAHNKQQ